MLSNVDARNYRSTTFQAALTEDSIIYTNIRIPRHAESVRIKVQMLDSWIDEETKPYISVGDNATLSVVQARGKSQTSISRPTAYVRYDGVPRLDKFDASYELPWYPEALEIFDDSPSESVMYIGIWGGALLNSYRYFAGSPDTVDVLVQAEIEACDSELNYGTDCSSQLQILPLPTAPNAPIVLHFLQSQPPRAAIAVPQGAHGVQVQAVLSADSLHNICEAYKQALTTLTPKELDMDVISVELALRLYLNQPDEDQDSGKVTAQARLHELCIGNVAKMRAAAQVLLRNLDISLKRPIQGLWKFALEFAIKRSDSTDSHKSLSVVSAKDWESLKNALGLAQLGVALKTELMQCRSGYIGFDDLIYVQKFKLVDGKYHLQPTNTSYINCQVPIIDMECKKSNDPLRNVAHFWSQEAHILQEWYVRSEDDVISYAKRNNSAVGMYLSLKNAARETNANPALDSIVSSTLAPTLEPYVAFAASLEHMDINSVLGGVLQVQLRVRPYVDKLSRLHPNQANTNVSSTDLMHWLQRTQFNVAIRGGALAGDPNGWILPEFLKSKTSRNDAGESHFNDKADNFDTFSQNSITLSTTTAQVVSLDDASATDEDGNSLYMVPNYEDSVLPLPAKLRYEEFLGNEDEKVRSSRQGLLYTWTIDKPKLQGLVSSAFYSGRSVYLRVSKGSPSPLENFSVSVHLNFEPCSPASCGDHGICFTQPGEVSVGACMCAYPYGGHDCDMLSLPYSLYLVQVLTLMCSNLAMIPAMILCIRRRHYVIAVILGLSAFSSMVYHACDSDFSCLLGMSNSTFQLFDVFFCVQCFQVILIYHSALEEEKMLPILVVLMGILLPGIAENPTDMTWISWSIGSAVVVMVGTWLVPAFNACRRLYSRRNAATEFTYKEVQLVHSKNESDENESYSLESGAENDSDLRVTAPDNGDDANATWTRVPTKASSSVYSGQTVQQSYMTSRDYSSSSGKVWNRTCVLQLFYEIRFTCIGISVLVIGVSCFAFQTRTSYWITHSSWHAVTMMSSYFCLRGMPVLKSNLSRLLNEH